MHSEEYLTFSLLVHKMLTKLVIQAPLNFVKKELNYSYPLNFLKSFQT